MAAVRHLGFVTRVWYHPRRAFGGLYHCAKFGWNRCSSFDNVRVFRFREFGLKTPIHAPKLGVFRGKIGEGVRRYWPQQTRSYFWGFTRLCSIWWKSTKKCDRESVHRRHTHAWTDAKRFYYLPRAICYSYGADNNFWSTDAPGLRREPRPLSASRSIAHGDRLDRVRWPLGHMGKCASIALHGKNKH